MSSVAIGADTPVKDSVRRNEKEVFTHQQENEASAGEWRTLNLGACLSTRRVASFWEEAVFRALV